MALPSDLSAEFWRLLVDNSGDALCVLDQTGHVRYASASITELLGYSPEAVVGMNAFDLVHPEDAVELRGRFSQRLANAPLHGRGEFRYQHKDGSWRYLDALAVNKIDDPAIGGIVVSYRDVTNRRAAEAALRSSEERYRQLVEHASDIIYNCDVDGHFTFCNPIGQRVMKYREDELIGRHFLTLIRSDYRAEAASFYAAQIATGTPSSYFEFPAVAKDGTEVWFGQNVQLVTHAGRPAGVQAIARDITQRRALEEQLGQAQKMEAIGRLAGGVAHDFNNLLTAILASAELLTLQLPPGDPLREEADAIAHSAERGAGLTRQLLDFSRPQSGESTTAELGGLVHRMDDMLRRLVFDQIIVSIDTSSEPVYIKSVEGQLEQIIMNLVLNARDATPADGVVSVRTRPTTLDEVKAQRLGVSAGQYAVLSVADTGGGMDQDTLEHIFEPFFTTKNRNKGTGLGLSIVYTIVKRLGGGIKVSSEVGRGSTFSVYLPVISPPAQS